MKRKNAEPRPSKHWLAMTLLLILGATFSAQAQTGGRHGKQQQQPPTTQTSPTPTPQPEPVDASSPKLLKGTILCKSEDDLIKYQAGIAAGADAPVDAVLGCRVVREPTAVEILKGDGASHTQVVTTDAAKETGWTNAYLPSDSSSSAATSSNSGTHHW